MGQKVNPHGLRVGVIKNWDSRWFAKDSVFGDTLVEDYNLRKYLKKTLFTAGIAKIEIERDEKRVRLHIHCAKPGMVIGRNGSGKTVLCGSEAAVTDTVTALVRIKRSLGWLPARIPDGVTVFYVIVFTIVVVRNVVVTIAG